MSGKEPDCETCIVRLRPDNEDKVAVYNTTMAVKNLGLEAIFPVMEMLGIKDKVITVAAAIKLAAEFKERQKREDDLARE